MVQYKKYALLIIDEWLLYPLKETEARDLLKDLKASGEAITPKHGNPRAHIMLTMRPLKLDGHWGAKCRKVYDLDGNGDRIPAQLYEAQAQRSRSGKIKSLQANAKLLAFIKYDIPLEYIQ